MAGTLHKIELDGIRVDQTAQLDAMILIWRETGPGTLSKLDATYTNPATLTIYSGACFFAPIVSRRDRFDVHGEQQVYQNQNRVLLPWDAGAATGEDIKIGDFARVTSSEDSTLDLRDMVVKDVLLVSDISMRRLTLVDIKE